jgi:hypothetical protein
MRGCPRRRTLRPPEDRVDRAARALDTLHAESAFRLDRQNPSTRFIVPAQKALSYFLPASGLISTETARLGTRTQKRILSEVCKAESVARQPDTSLYLLSTPQLEAAEARSQTVRTPPVR